MSKASKTDWERLEKLRDYQVDMSDMPELGDEFFSRAQLHVPLARPNRQAMEKPAVIDGDLIAPTGAKLACSLHRPASFIHE